MMKKFTKTGIAAILTAAVMLSGMPAYATPQDEIDSAQQYVDSTETSLMNVETRIANLEAKKDQTEEYLKEVNNQLAELTNQLKELEVQYSDKQKEIDSINLDLAAAEADKAVQHDNMKVRIQYMYENSDSADAFTAVFAGADFMNALSSVNDIAELESYDREMLQNYVTICQQIEDTKARLQEEQAAIDVLRDKSRSKKDELQTVYNETRARVDEIAASLKSSQTEAAILVQNILAQQSAIEVMTRNVAEEIAAADAAAGQTIQTASDSSGSTAEISDNSAAASETADTGAADTTAVETPAASNVSETPVSTPAAAADSTAADNTVSDSGSTALTGSDYGGPVLDRQAGKIRGPECEETYYSLEMSGVVDIMRNMGNTDDYWVRDDGVKMLGDYVMVAANLDEHPRGSLVQSSLGMAIVCDTGGFAVDHPDRIDVAVNW
ncbi:MAG: hypothetical protein Q4B22_02215 [Eubacteriales bacterium]|nr:hypothetical protein [Eubacteriales bacterium]